MSCHSTVIKIKNAMNTFNKILPLALSLAYFLLISLVAFGQSSNDSTSKPKHIDTIFSKVQVSYLPFISTSGYHCKDGNYDFSLNILGGYVNGVNKLEVAGWFNIDRNHVKMCQVAGITNVVLGSVKGIQIAGWINTAQQVQGVQVAGLVNDAQGGKARQFAGLINFAADTTPVQVAGLINIANHAKVQIASLVNVSKTVTGLQLGLLNIADSCTGIPVGLLSINKNGYHKLEFGADEVFYNAFSYRGGVKAFHNIFTVAIQPQTLDNPVWAYGYGIGTSFGNPAKTLFDIDLTVRHVMKNERWYEVNDIYSLALGVDKKLSSKISVALALTGNVYVTDTDYGAYDGTFSKLTPAHLYNHTYSNGIQAKAWVGGRIGLRFF